MTAYRLPNGGLIDRTKPLSFTFEGKTYTGYHGDSLASALLANGVSIMGRSFKYHRPRGLLGIGCEEPNAILELETGDYLLPNQRASTTALYAGLTARVGNAWPNLSFDVLSINSMFSRWLPAGFYYKTFKWPNWHMFEPLIRRAAGLGCAPNGSDPDNYVKQFAECDLLIVGGGAAGLTAASEAGRRGMRVLLVEQDEIWGGSLNWRAGVVDNTNGRTWIATTLRELRSRRNVKFLKRAMAFGYYDHNLVAVCERLTDHKPVAERRGPRQRMWKVRAKTVLLATGALERPLIFPNNDRPGVMLASTGVALARRFGVAPGKRVVLAGNNDLLTAYAESMESAGVSVVAVVDSRGSERTNPDNRLTKHLHRSLITDVKGRRGVRAVEIHEMNAAGHPARGTRRTISCDAVLTSSGLSPAAHLFSQSGGKLLFDDDLLAFLPHDSGQSVRPIGAAAGDFSLDSARIGATEAVSEFGEATQPRLGAHRRRAFSIAPVWETQVESIGRFGQKAFVDFQNDVTTADIRLALQENFRSVEHVKRYTTLGMATDQGKTSNVNGIGIMADALGKRPGDVGTTTFRPPYDPVPLGLLAGSRVGPNLVPLRRLAAHDAHLERDARFDEYGHWWRPAYYPLHGEDEHTATQREASAVRKGIGLFDASPLGKIEVFGADAVEFLDRIYANNVKTLEPSRCRYGLMLDDNGIVFDDGVLARMGEYHYLVGTTSARANLVAEHLEEWLQCEWRDLEVVTRNVTTGWAVININGPKARDLICQFESDIDFGADAFPHMHFRQGHLNGVPVRVQRVSFSGELSYEVSVPWHYGHGLWEACLDAGKPLGAIPFGVEALDILRVEKGFLHVGTDTDGTTYPQDVGFGRVIEKKAADFVGRRSTMRPDASRQDRRQLVGLENVTSDHALAVGAHIVTHAGNTLRSEGFVTSSHYSPNLKRTVALGLVENGRARAGACVHVWDRGRETLARIVAAGAYDPTGERLNG